MYRYTSIYEEYIYIHTCIFPRQYLHLRSSYTSSVLYIYICIYAYVSTLIAIYLNIYIYENKCCGALCAENVLHANGWVPQDGGPGPWAQRPGARPGARGPNAPGPTRVK